MQLRKRSSGQFGSCAAQGMAKGNGAAVGIHLCRIKVELANDCESLGGESLIEA